MAAQELRWLTYLLTDLGEPPRSPPVLYVDNKAMPALCWEHRLEHRTKHIALRYFLARELQQRGQLRLAYMASEANTADIFTKALPPGDHQRFCTMLACFALLDWSCDLLFSPTLPMGRACTASGSSSGTAAGSTAASSAPSSSPPFAVVSISAKNSLSRITEKGILVSGMVIWTKPLPEVPQPLVSPPDAMPHSLVLPPVAAPHLPMALVPHPPALPHPPSLEALSSSSHPLQANFPRDSACLLWRSSSACCATICFIVGSCQWG
ncbi:unnamed protein product [Closterium sp. NIES-53]